VREREGEREGDGLELDSMLDTNNTTKNVFSTLNVMLDIETPPKEELRLNRIHTLLGLSKD